MAYNLVGAQDKYPSSPRNPDDFENTYSGAFTNEECLSLHNFLGNYKGDKDNCLEELLNIFKSCPAAPTIRNAEGDLPLHMICRRWFPDWIVEIVLKANVKAVKEVDKNGNLPLGIACGSYANKHLIVALCKLYPRAASVRNHNGNAPIHDICSADPDDPPPIDYVKVLVDASPEMASKPDSEGCLLVLKACEWVLSVATLILNEEDNFFYWPEDMPELLHSLYNLKCFLKAAPILTGTAMEFMCITLDERFDECCHLATSLALQFIIEAATPISEKSLQLKLASNRHWLMSLVLSGEPNISFKAFQVLFGNQWEDAKLIAQTEDGKKSFPLHIASRYGKDVDPCIIEYLVNLNPQAASCIDVNGKLPLHLALENDLPLPSIEAIFYAYPSAVMGSYRGNDSTSSLIAPSNDAPLDVIRYLLEKYPVMPKR